MSDGGTRPRRSARGLPAAAPIALGSLLALAWLLALGGCRKEGRLYRCECDVLTDTDGQTSLVTRHCAEDAAAAERSAPGCTIGQAAGTVERCRCVVEVSESKHCWVGKCYPAATP